MRLVMPCNAITHRAFASGERKSERMVLGLSLELSLLECSNLVKCCGNITNETNKDVANRDATHRALMFKSIKR